MPGQFTDHLWESIAPIYARILEHPFVVGLADGSLRESAFRYYAVQDAIYLKDFARCIAAASAKAPVDAWAETLADHAHYTFVGERALHEDFFQSWGLTPDLVYAAPASPTCLAYTSYLVRVAWREPFEEALASLLPCYWIYWEVGKRLEASGSSNPLFQRWIDLYASEEFGGPVRHVLSIMNESVADLGNSRLERLRKHFVTTSQYEWMFWDAAWRQEDWPVSAR